VCWTCEMYLNALRPKVTVAEVVAGEVINSLICWPRTSKPVMRNPMAVAVPPVVSETEIDRHRLSRGLCNRIRPAWIFFEWNEAEAVAGPNCVPMAIKSPPIRFACPIGALPKVAPATGLIVAPVRLEVEIERTWAISEEVLAELPTLPI